MSDREPPAPHTDGPGEGELGQHPSTLGFPPGRHGGGAALDNKWIFANEEDNVIIFE